MLDARRKKFMSTKNQLAQSALAVGPFWRLCALCVALIAISVKAVLPMGFMFSPSSGGQGHFIEICSSSGLKTIAVSAETGAQDKHVFDDERPAQTSADHDALCSFSFAASLNAPAVSFIGIVFIPATTGLEFAQLAQNTHALSRLSRHLTRAPPVIS